MSSKSQPLDEMWVKTEPDWDETSGELLTGHVQVKEEVVDLKEEAELKDSTALYGVSESPLVALYAGHEVKDELVLGPECLQPADIVFTLYAAQALNVKEQCVPRDCVVRLERVARLEALLKSKTHSNTNIATDRDIYVCNVCEKIFALKTQLMEHAMIHIRQSSEREGSTRGVADNAETARGRDQHRDHTYAKTGCTLAEGNLKHEEIKTAGAQKCSVSRQVHSDADEDVGEIPSVEHLETADSTKETIPYKCYSSAYKKYDLVSRDIKLRGEKQYKCSYCSYASARKDYLRVHLRKHTGEIPYKCSHCSYASARKRDLVIHESKHTGVKLYKCGQCSYTSAHKGNVRVHEKKHTSEKQYKCRYCSYASTKIIPLEIHERKHTGEIPYKCSHCSYASARKRDLVIHESKHTGVKLYKCGQCSYTNAHKGYVRVHEKKHTSEKQYKCRYCSYASTKKKPLEVHERKHIGEVPYKCSHCSYASARKRDLVIHESKHTGVKLYKCGQCSYTSAHKGYVRVHERKHTGEKPYKCNRCSFATAYNSSLRVHERKHTGEKPYKCRHCSFTSAREDYFRDHERKHTRLVVHIKTDLGQSNLTL